LFSIEGFKDQALEMSQFRVKNFWGKGDAYQGINSVRFGARSEQRTHRKRSAN
jgi:hypothetical protein